MAIGWNPEGTATHQRGANAVTSFAVRQSLRQLCAWCWGQGYLVERSVLGWVPVACPICVEHADDVD